MFAIVALVLSATTIAAKTQAIVSAIEGAATLLNKGYDSLNIPAVYLGPDEEDFTILHYQDRVAWERMLVLVQDENPVSMVMAMKVLFDVDRGGRVYTNLTEEQRDIVRAARRVWEKCSK